MDEKLILKMYEIDGLSTYQIATHFSTYANKIRRILIKHKVKLDSKSEAQKKALSSGRSKHPTEGRNRTDDEKLAISKKLADYWDDLDDTTRENRVEQARERWKNMPASKRDEIAKKAVAGIRKASKDGSAIENFVFKNIKYHAVQHVTDLIANENLEIDIYVPELSTIIEIDGPSHFKPIWGEEKFLKQVKSDTEKNGLILSGGFVIIRVRILRNSTLDRDRTLVNNINQILDQIKANFPPKGSRLIEVDL